MCNKYYIRLKKSCTVHMRACRSSLISDQANNMPSPGRKNGASTCMSSSKPPCMVAQKARRYFPVSKNHCDAALDSLLL